MKQDAYRQGDVILVPVKEAKGEKENHLVLAEGEVTGHAHRVSVGEAALYKFEEQFYLKVQSDIATLTHEEHGPIELPAGNYRVIKQREYTPKGNREVVD